MSAAAMRDQVRAPGTSCRATILSSLALVSLAAVAQQPLAPATPRPGAVGGAASTESRSFISAAEIAARIARADAAAKAGKPYNEGPLLLQPPFKASMEYRTGASGHFTSHETNAELFVVLEGSGTMTIGGTLVNPKREGDNLQSATIQGGVPRKLTKGDIFMVPEKTAHSVTSADGKLVLMYMQLPYPAPAPAAAR
jgi:mannose-6-phosphate isomerase-like protein (cupin superfamily)